MGTRHFLKDFHRRSNGGILRLLWKKEGIRSPWLWFIKDSVKEIEVRRTQTGHPYGQIIDDYLHECRPFLTENQLNDLSNHLINVFGVDEKPYF